jgi:hypothetical protein
MFKRGLRAGQVDAVMAFLVSSRGAMTLHGAARSGDAAEAERLVKAGADVEQQDAAGKRALHWAAKHGHVEVIRTLALLGAVLDPQVVHTPSSNWLFPKPPRSITTVMLHQLSV